MIIRCVDFETTGLSPADGAAVCEIGVCDVTVKGPGEPGAIVGVPRACFVNPMHHIPPGMSAIHHITDADILRTGARLFSEAAADLILAGGPDILCAHHAAFERLFFTVPAKWICSYRVAVVVAPRAPSHGLQELRYWATLGVDAALASPAHRAGPDAYVNAVLLARLLAVKTPDEMLAISAGPVLLPRFHFGEHRGKPLSDIPTSYFDWIVNKSRGPWDEDVLYTARSILDVRRRTEMARSPVDTTAVAGAQAAAENRQ